MAGTWATHATPASGGKQIFDVLCVGSGKFVAVGETGLVITSSDSGVTWTSRTAALAQDWSGLGTDGAGNVVAVRGDATNAVMTSADFGVTWTAQTTPAEADDWQSVCWDAGSNQWIAIATSGPHQVMTSPDGAVWTVQNASSALTWIGVASSGSLIMAVSDSGDVMTSTNGTAWTGHASPNTQLINGADKGNGAIRWSSLLSAFVIAGADSSISPISAVAYSTPTGVTWTTASTDTTTAFFKAIQMANAIGGFVASMPFDPDFTPGTPTIVGNSVDAGVSWTHEDTTFTGAWYIGAWDDSTGTVVYKDRDTDTMLVGTFSTATFDSIDPDDGTTLGGTPVTCTGTGFTGLTTVNFDGTPATSVVVVNDTTITCVTPAHAAGAVDVEVVGAGTLVNGYTYETSTFTSLTPDSGTVSGGTLVTLTGTFFEASMVVNFDGTPGTVEGVFNNRTKLTVRTPAHAAGLVDVEVVGVDTLVNAYTYVAVLSITPNRGTISGSTPVTIRGGGFSGATGVEFDGIPGTEFVVVSDTTIHVVTPAHAAGAVDVEVLVGIGTLVGGYTYVAKGPLKLPPIPVLSPAEQAGGDTYGGGAAGKGKAAGGGGGQPMGDAYVKWLMAVKQAIENQSN